MPAPSEFVASVVRAEIRALKAYEVADAAGLVKLDAMENPYPLPQDVRAKIAAAVADVPINRYPDGGAKGVKSALREAFGIGEGFGIVLGNGSDELIQMLTVAVAAPGATIMAPDPSFVMYRMNAVYAGVSFVGVPLAADFSLDSKAMHEAIEREKPALIFLAYPNNPTGNLFAPDHIDAVLRAAPGLVVIDEAYHAFAGTSYLPRLREFPNLVVMRTVSKIGMAGLRLGYGIGQPETLKAISSTWNLGSINTLTAAAGIASMKDTEHIAEEVAENARVRSFTLQAFKDMGYAATDSHANCIFVDLKQNAPAFRDACLALKVQVGRDFPPYEKTHTRITLGTMDEMRQAVEVFKKVLTTRTATSSAQ